MADNLKVQLAVVGAGPAGYPAAFRAADLGMSVALIDQRSALGGTCLHEGCIPSKALLHAALIKNEAKSASAFGLYFTEPRLDIDALRIWKNGLVGQLSGGLGMLCKQRAVQFVQGRARFTGPNSILVEQAGEERSVEFDRAIIATGSRPLEIPELKTESDRIMTARGALELNRVPESMLVIGGGYIGLELGSVYASLGARVSVAEMTDGLLPGADRDLVRILSRSLEPRFEALMLQTRVAGLTEDNAGLRAKLISAQGDTVEKSFDSILVAAGRRPATEDLGLENTKVKLDDKGFIITDERRQTGEPSIFAAGDAAGQPMLAHKAMHEALATAEYIATGKGGPFTPRAIPAVVFTDPEIAWCGLTEDQARAENQNIKVGRFPWSASGRAKTLHRADGMTKVIANAESGAILGLAIAGPGAGDLIAEGVLAVESGVTVETLSRVIHPHPTLSETVMEAAEALLGRSVHAARPR